MLAEDTKKEGKMTNTRTLLTSALLIPAVLGSSGCGDKKLRKRVAAFDTAKLTEIQDIYPADSKAVLFNIRQHIAGINQVKTYLSCRNFIAGIHMLPYLMRRS